MYKRQVNGCLVSYGKVPPFIVTLGAMQIARGLALLINGGQPISSFPKGLGSLMASKVLDVYKRQLHRLAGSGV